MINIIKNVIKNIFLKKKIKNNNEKVVIVKMEDKILTCKDCGREFIFTEGEQLFYEEKEFSDPVRCPECRRARKQERNNRQ